MANITANQLYYSDNVFAVCILSWIFEFADDRPITRGYYTKTCYNHVWKPFQLYLAFVNSAHSIQLQQLNQSTSVSLVYSNVVQYSHQVTRLLIRCIYSLYLLFSDQIRIYQFLPFIQFFLLCFSVAVYDCTVRGVPLMGVFVYIRIIKRMMCSDRGWTSGK